MKREKKKSNDVTLAVLTWNDKTGLNCKSVLYYGGNATVLPTEEKDILLKETNWKVSAFNIGQATRKITAEAYGGIGNIVSLCHHYDKDLPPGLNDDTFLEIYYFYT